MIWWYRVRCGCASGINVVNLRAFYARGVIGYVLGTVIRRRYLISGIQYSDEYQDYDERSTRQSAEGRVSNS